MAAKSLPLAELRTNRLQMQICPCQTFSMMQTLVEIQFCPRRDESRLTILCTVRAQNTHASKLNAITHTHTGFNIVSHPDIEYH